MEKKQYFSYLNEQYNDEKLLKIEEYAKEKHVPIIQKSALDLIRVIMKIYQVKKVLEIGSAIGYSAITVALVSQNVSVTTIERDEAMIEQAKENIKSLSLEERIHLISDDALNFDEISLDKDYDLLFIDAAKSQYEKFFNKYTKCLKKGGLVITDNLIFHDLVFADHIENRRTRQLVNKIKKFNEWLKNNEDFETTFINIGDGLSISIKK